MSRRSYTSFDDSLSSVRVFPFELATTEQVKLFDEPLTAEAVGDSYFLMGTTTGKILNLYCHHLQNFGLNNYYFWKFF